MTAPIAMNYGHTIELNKKTGMISSLFSLASEPVQKWRMHVQGSSDLSRTEPHDRT